MTSIKVGDKFGKLEVIQTGLHKKVGKRMYTAVLCECECHNKTLVAIKHLKQGKVKSCGCLKYHRINPDDMFGDLKAIRRVDDIIGKNNRHFEAWECLCTACGKTVIVKANYLRQGKKTHCGCKRTCTSSKKYAPIEIGKVYGDWEVIEKLPKQKWLCKCTKCGALKAICDYQLKTKVPKCRTHLVGPMINQIFGRLKVISRAPDKVYKNGQHEIRYLCECQRCGTRKTVRADRLRLGIVRSCGCLQSDKSSHAYVEKALLPLSYSPKGLRTW